MKILSVLLLVSFSLLISPVADANNTSFCASDCSYEIRMFRKYTKQGSSLAELSLGIMYLQGKGTERNIESGVRHITRAAQDGEPAAIYQLGYMYLFGMFVEQDVEKAKLILKRAKNKGVLSARKYLELIDKNEKGELSSITLEAYRENEKKEELVSAVNDAKRRALAGDIEVIVVDGGFDYRQVVEAADSQVCREKSCGPGWSFVLMPMVKLTPVVEQILFGEASSYAQNSHSQAV